MKGFLYSQDGSYAFPLGPKVTTIGRENCDISINSPHVDSQHALIEYDDGQRCFILKDLNSSSGTYVHDCRVQNAAVRLADGDFVRFGFNGLPLEFRVEQPPPPPQQQESSMPSIYPRAPASNSLHLISQTIPSRRATSNTTNYPQQLDVRQNPGFTLRSRPLSAGSKKGQGVPMTNHVTPDSHPRVNAWTMNATINPSRSIINGSFVGEVDVTGPDNTELTSRVDQLEREIKGRDTEIRHLTDRLRSLEPMSSTFSSEVHSLKAELDKVRREKQAASGLISSLQRDLHSKESNLAKLGREVDGLKTDSRDKDLRLQSLQGKLNLLRDRSRAEEDRNNKEKETKLKMNEQQISELTENVQRLKSQLQETEKQVTKFSQNEQKLKQECEHLRGQLNEFQRNETTLKTDLADQQRKHQQLCVNIWRCLTSSNDDDDDDDEYDEDQHNIVEQIQQLQQELTQTRAHLEQQQTTQSTNNEQFQTIFRQFFDILTNTMQDQTSMNILQRGCQQINGIESAGDEENLSGIFKRTVLHAMQSQIKLVSALLGLIFKQEDQNDDLTIPEIFTLIRRQNDEFEEEKQNLITEFNNREQTIRIELEQMNNDKDLTWQQRFNDECDRLRQQNSRLQGEYDDQTRSLSERLESISAQNSEHLQKLNDLQSETTEKIDELTRSLEECQRDLSDEREQKDQQMQINEQQKEEFDQMEKEKNSIITDLNGQMDVFKDQVRQFSITIVQLEKKYEEEHDKHLRLQTEFDQLNKKGRSSTSSPVVENISPPVIPVLTAPVADLSQELFAYKSRVQEQEQIIVSLRRDLAGMTARLSDVQGELSEKQKRALEKSEATIREQTKELNETRLKLSKLSDIVDKQSTQIETLQSDLTKSKHLSDQYQLLVDQRQAEIDRLNQSLEQKNLVVERVEKNNQDEGRITHELVAIGAQCKGERHELTITRQREALNELRARIKSLEQSRPANPSYEKVLQQVVLLKRELAELRARQALPTDIPYLTGSSSSPSAQQSSQRVTRQSPPTSLPSDPTMEGQKILEERTAHAETINSLQSCDDLYNKFIRKLIQLLDIDDDSLLTVSPLANAPTADRYVALQQRQRATEILAQKIEMFRERLARKEELLRDYEKDLGRLRQAEILLREKDALLQDLETDKRTKDDEALFLRNTLKETQDHLNQEKRVNSSIKLGRGVDQNQSTDLIRRSGGSTHTLHHHCPPDTTGKVRTIKRNFNEKIHRKDYEIKTLKHELNDALDKISDQSHQVKLLEIQSKHTTTDDEH